MKLLAGNHFQNHDLAQFASFPGSVVRKFKEKEARSQLAKKDICRLRTAKITTKLKAHQHDLANRLQTALRGPPRQMQFDLKTTTIFQAMPIISCIDIKKKTRGIIPDTAA